MSPIECYLNEFYKKKRKCVSGLNFRPTGWSMGVLDAYSWGLSGAAIWDQKSLN